MDAWNASDLVLYAIVAVAVVLDFKYMRISNRLIFMGIFLALACCLIGRGVSDVIYVLWNISFPVVVLYLFYLLGAVGAGDVKLFSIIGGFVNFKELVSCMAFSFVIGAVWSIGKMLYSGTFFEGLRSGFCYFGELLQGKRVRYPRSSENPENLIHFSLAIFLGLLLAKIYHQFM